MTPPEPVEATAPFRIRNALLTITRCWPHMLPTAPAATITGTIGRHATGSRPPVAAHVLDARSQALSRLAGWTLVVLDDRGLNARVDGHDALAMAKLLKTHADWLADHEASEDVLSELEDSARRCQAIAEPHAALKFAGSCDVCGGDLMSDGRIARCRGCKQVVDGETQVERVRAAVRDRLMTAAELITLSPQVGKRLHRFQFDRWVKAGKIASHATNLDGKPMYPVSDFLTLLIPEVRQEAS